MVGVSMGHFYPSSSFQTKSPAWRWTQNCIDSHGDPALLHTHSSFIIPYPLDAKKIPPYALNSSSEHTFFLQVFQKWVLVNIISKTNMMYHWIELKWSLKLFLYRFRMVSLIGNKLVWYHNMMHISCWNNANYQEV